MAISTPLSTGNPDDNERPRHRARPGTLLYERAETILDWIRHPNRTGKPFSVNEVAARTNIPNKGRIFTDALCEARKMALDQDEVITYCSYDIGTGLYFFRHLMPEAEDGKLFPGSATRGQSIVAQIVNFVSHEEWGARHAKHPLERQLYKSRGTALASVAIFADQFRDLGRAIFEERQRQEREDSA